MKPNKIIDWFSTEEKVIQIYWYTNSYTETQNRNTTFMMMNESFEQKPEDR